MLEQAGAKPPEDFKIDAAQLASYAGTFKNAAGNELVDCCHRREALDRARRGSAGAAGTLAAKDATTFRASGWDLARLQD